MTFHKPFKGGHLLHNEITELSGSEDLKSGDFFWDQHLPLPPPTEFANAAPSGKFHFWFGPLQAILREKRVDLSVWVFNWLNTHPIRLSLI